MHFIVVLVLYLRVNGLKREWWIDLPELTSIQLGYSAFVFKNYDESSELIMRSDNDEMKWWIDLPKLTSLTTTISSFSFCSSRFITLEGTSYHLSITNRHALSHHCYSYQGLCFQREDNCSYQEFPFPVSLIPRHHSRSPMLSLLPSFFHTLFTEWNLQSCSTNPIRNYH